MVKYFLAYTEEDRELAERISDELLRCGLALAGLKDADCLLMLLSAQGQADEPEMRKAWEYFDGELRWKRKTRGEILILATSEDALDSLPLRLKKCGYFLTTEVDDAAAYLDDAYGAKSERSEADAQKPTESKYKFPEVKEIKYTPNEDKIESPKYDGEAPKVDPFDGKPLKKRDDEKESGACKEDHVFEDDFGTTEIKRVAKARAKGGCAFAIVFLLMVFVVALSFSLKVSRSCDGLEYALIDAVAFSGEFDSAGLFGGLANALQKVALMI